MSRLLRLAAVAFALPFLIGAVGPDDQQRALERIEDWLNELRSLRAEFVQFAPDGGRATGDLLFKRPDKMRLDYDPPSPVLIIANGWEVNYYDRKLDQTSSMLTSATPLAFLFEDEISFEDGVRVTEFARDNGQIRVTVAETGDEDEGSITLFFDEDPVALRRWAVTDAQGLTTHVVLDDVELNVPIGDDRFRLRDLEQRFRRDD